MGVGIAVVGLAMSAYGMYSSYQAQSKQASYYSGMQDYYNQSAYDYKSGMDYWNKKNRKAQFEAAMDEAEAAKMNAEAFTREANMSQFQGEMNLKAAEMDAVEIKRRAEQAAYAVRMEADALAGEQVVSYHSANVVMSGTPGMVMMEDMDKAEQDIADIMAAGNYDALMAKAGGLMDAATAESAVDRALTGSLNSLAQARGALKGAGWASTLLNMDNWQTNQKAWEIRTNGRMAGMQSDLANYSARTGLAMNAGNMFMQFGMYGGRGGGRSNYGGWNMY
jgi:hypothetical protein